jgi:hypothetical protein
MSEPNELRIKISDLPSRDDNRNEAELEKALSGLGAREGSPCELNCDCAIGLVCRDRVCAADW